MLIHAALNKGIRAFRSKHFQINMEPRIESDPHLRISQLGACGRKIWFLINGQFPEDVFSTEGLNAVHFGDMTEEYTFHILQLGGLKVYGNQIEVKDLPGGALSGHIDGVIQIAGVDYLLEIKTLKHSSVEHMIAHGLKSADYLYYVQMQSYMKCLDFKSGYMIALDKDTGQYYVELVYADPEFQKYLQKKAMNIHTSTDVSMIAEPFVTRDCKWCPMMEQCASMDGGETEFIKLYREKHGTA